MVRAQPPGNPSSSKLLAGCRPSSPPSGHTTPDLRHLAKLRSLSSIGQTWLYLDNERRSIQATASRYRRLWYISNSYTIALINLYSARNMQLQLSLSISYIIASSILDFLPPLLIPQQSYQSLQRPRSLRRNWTPSPLSQVCWEELRPGQNQDIRKNSHSAHQQ